MDKTVTIVAAFRNAFQRRYAGGTADHLAEVNAAAVWAGEWLSSQPEGLGFTATPSFGGGAGWDTEVGVAFTFAGVPAERVLAVVRFARALKVREEQQAVVVLVRDEGFSLIE
jgi:hypothetical protein